MENPASHTPIHKLIRKALDNQKAECKAGIPGCSPEGAVYLYLKHAGFLKEYDYTIEDLEHQIESFREALKSAELEILKLKNELG